MVERLPNQTREIDIPIVISSLVQFYMSRNLHPDECIKFKDGDTADSAVEILERFGLNPNDERARAIKLGTQLVATHNQGWQTLNDMIFYKSTDLYGDEELAEIATLKLYPYDPFESADRDAQEGIIFEDALLAALEKGKSLVTLADFLTQYAEGVQLMSGKLANTK